MARLSLTFKDSGDLGPAAMEGPTMNLNTAKTVREVALEVGSNPCFRAAGN